MRTLNFIFIIFILELVLKIKGEISEKRYNNTTTNEAQEYLLAMKRLEFAQKYNHLITGGKIQYEYSPTGGLYCVAKENLKYSEFIMNIPKNFLISTFDLFPFKMEFFEAFQSYYTTYNYTNIFNHIEKSLTAIQLTLMNNKNKQALDKELKNAGYSSYIVNYTSEALEYLETLPKEIYTYNYLTNEDSELYFQFMNNVEKLLNYYLESFEYTREYFKIKFPKIEKIIWPYISFDNYNYFISIYLSRAFLFDLRSYEIINNQSLIYMPMGYRLNQKLGDFHRATGSALVPFLDLCNHIMKSPDQEIVLKTIPVKDYWTIGFTSDFIKGEEVAFTYNNKPSNYLLFHKYGFILENNFVKNIEFKKIFDFSSFNQRKLMLCDMVNCLNIDPKSLNLTNSNKLYAVSLTITDKFNSEIMNFYRIDSLPANENFELKNYANILKHHFTISYSNEIMSLANYRKLFMTVFSISKFSYTDALYSIHNVRKYYDDNYEQINQNKTLRYNYNIRRNLMELVRENKHLFLNHVQLSQKRIKSLISNQFEQIKNYLIKN